MKIVDMIEIVGDFGEDKDAAATIRRESIVRELALGHDIALDFAGVTLVTQSFIHALISDALRTRGEEALDHIEFRNCVEVVRGIIATVVQYSLDSMEGDAPELPLENS